MQFLNYSDEVSKIKKKLKTDKDTGLQPSVSKKSKDEENEEEDSEESEGHSEMRQRV